jgi:hypothetical protein
VSLTVAISDPRVTAAGRALRHVPGHVQLLRVARGRVEVLGEHWRPQKHVVVEVDELLGQTLCMFMYMYVCVDIMLFKHAVRRRPGQVSSNGSCG